MSIKNENENEVEKNAWVLRVHVGGLLFACLLLRLYVLSCACMLACLFAFLCACMYACMVANTSACLFAFLFACLPFCLFACLLVYLSAILFSGLLVWTIVCHGSMCQVFVETCQSKKERAALRHSEMKNDKRKGEK